MTEIGKTIECDTFIPTVDSSTFQPWYSSLPVSENNIRYCFASYVRTKTSRIEPHNQSQELNCNISSKLKEVKISNFTFLPKMIFEKHDEFMYLRLVQDIIWNGSHKDDRKGTGTLYKSGSRVNKHSNLLGKQNEHKYGESRLIHYVKRIVMMYNARVSNL
ncbi:hypothetical protein RND71_038314 [Anisodus tanguticus]|uniref:Uncharacterized protein n=1 Tax=Anisodus tanguticus TaxID=243964 RepID=A0AAE1R099_9SOLA|nr:hypothetical protein RND71_038314 [Anisodus tanguticus]